MVLQKLRLAVASIAACLCLVNSAMAATVTIEAEGTFGAVLGIPSMVNFERWHFFGSLRNGKSVGLSTFSKQDLAMSSFYLGGQPIAFHRRAPGATTNIDISNHGTWLEIFFDPDDPIFAPGLTAVTLRIHAGTYPPTDGMDALAIWSFASATGTVSTYDSAALSVAMSEVPLPASAPLVAMGVIALLQLRRKKAQAARLP